MATTTQVGNALGPQSYLSPSGFLNNYNGAADPVVTNDASQGYGPGSEWLCPTTGRNWTCQSNAIGAAVWVFDGAVLGNPEPSGIVTQFGSSTASFPEEGNVSRQVSSAGVSPGGTGSDYVVAVYAVPASGFDISGRGLQITAAGSFASNGDAKTLKIVVSNTAQVVGSATASSPTVIATTGSVSTNGGGWQISANIFKYGAAGSNTQLALHSQAQVGAAVSALQVPTATTLTESAIIYLAITANTSTATDVVFNWLEINAMN